MIVQKIWKRIRCPTCKALIRVLYATDGSFVLQDSKPSLHPPSEEPQQNETLTEAQEIAIKELIRKVVQEMDSEGFFDH